MSYIVLDMEWNQPWPGSPSARKTLPTHIRGEIIQIGAVRILEDQTIADEFQTLIVPKYYRRLNRRVSKLTGIKESQLMHDGVPFPKAIEAFHEWCGEDAVFLIWGFDDIGILRENLQLFGIEDQWVSKWYNAQMIFNAQTGSDSSQKALKTAMDALGIEATRPAHDALGDAFHTAQVCCKLDLAKGTEEYSKALKNHVEGFHGAELPGCLQRKVFYDFDDKWAALTAMAGEYNICPICGRQMLGSRWFSQPGHRYVDLATCPVDGKFLIRVRISEQPDGKVRVSRLTYEGSTDATESYTRRAERLDGENEHRHRRRKKTTENES